MTDNITPINKLVDDKGEKVSPYKIAEQLMEKIIENDYMLHEEVKGHIKQVLKMALSVLKGREQADGYIKKLERTLKKQENLIAKQNDLINKYQNAEAKWR